jgi:non-ribosomal peptide synthetase component F
MIQHSQLVDYVSGLYARIEKHQCRSFGLVSTLAADLGNTAIYGALLSGAALHILSDEQINDGKLLQHYIEQETLDCIKIVPSHWKALNDGVETCILPKRLLIFGGEALQASVLHQIRMSGTDCHIINHYGPTETTIGKLLHEINISNGYGPVVPIGQPFGNTQIYLLNQQKQLGAMGSPGEIYIGGAGVARGYLNRVELTAE